MGCSIFPILCSSIQGPPDLHQAGGGWFLTSCSPEAPPSWMTSHVCFRPHHEYPGSWRVWMSWSAEQGLNSRWVSQGFRSTEPSVEKTSPSLQTSQSKVWEDVYISSVEQCTCAGVAIGDGLWALAGFGSGARSEHFLGETWKQVKGKGWQTYN